MFSHWTKSTFHQQFLIKVNTVVSLEVNTCAILSKIKFFNSICGKVIGDTDPTSPTKKVFAIMISCLSKKWSQVVRLLPSNFSTAEKLYPMVNSVINDIEKCDLFVEVLVTDNYPLNVLLFILFSSNQKTLLPQFNIQLVQRESSMSCLILFTLSNR